MADGLAVVTAVGGGAHMAAKFQRVGPAEPPGDELDIRVVGIQGADEWYCLAHQAGEQLADADGPAAVSYTHLRRKNMENLQDTEKLQEE